MDSPDKDTGGLIAGILIGIFLLVIIGVLIVLYMKGYLATWFERLYSTCVSEAKEPTHHRLDTTEPPSSVSEKSEYAELSICRSSGRQSLVKGKIVYSDLGPGGGRLGPKPEIIKSEYAKVNNDAVTSVSSIYHERGPSVEDDEDENYNRGHGEIEEEYEEADHIIV